MAMPTEATKLPGPPEGPIGCVVLPNELPSPRLHQVTRVSDFYFDLQFHVAEVLHTEVLRSLDSLVLDKTLRYETVRKRWFPLRTWNHSAMAGLCFDVVIPWSLKAPNESDSRVLL